MAQIQRLSQILTGEILRHGTEKRADRAGNGHADRSDLERKRQMHNALCVKYAAAYCCDLKNAKSAVCGGKFTI